MSSPKNVKRSHSPVRMWRETHQKIKSVLREHETITSALDEAADLLQKKRSKENKNQKGVAE